MLEILGEAPSNTHWLRWFHKFQAPRIMMEFNPLRTWPDTLPLAFAHHSSKFSSSRFGASTCKPNLCRIENHSWRANAQETKRWSIVSWAWSQSGQAAGCCNPFLAKRSAVQHLLCAAVHKKNLHLLGAQLHHILSQGPDWIAPMKRASYADFVVYWPVVETFQIWVSSTSGCSSTFESNSHRLMYSIRTCTVSAPLMSETLFVEHPFDYCAAWYRIYGI